MGSSCSSAETVSYTAFLEAIARAQKLAPLVQEEHELNNECLPILQRLFRFGQEHILETLRLFGSAEQKLEFLQSVNDTNMELLDSLCHNLLPTKKQLQLNEIRPWQRITCLNPRAPENEPLKSLGLELIRTRKVMVMILAADIHLEFGHENLQLQPIDELPSRRCLLEIQLSRCNTIAELLEVRLDVIVVSTPYKEDLNKRLKWLQYKHLTIRVVDQFEIGLVDEDGKLLMSSPGCLYRVSNGTGDALARLAEERILEEAARKGVEYISVVPSNSLLDPMIDCLALGRMHSQALDCLAKAIDGETLPEHTRILQLSNNRIYAVDRHEFEFYKRTMKPSSEQERAYINAPALTNSYILRISYLSELVRSSEWNNPDNRLFRVKTVTVPIYEPIQQKNSIERALLFQKDLIDVFSFTQKFEVVRIAGQLYASIVTEKVGKCSLAEAVLKLSDLNKQWLGLKNSNRRQLCEISEEISVWGENLEDIRDELGRQTLSYPLYIHQF